MTEDKATTEAAQTAERRATALRSHALLVAEFDTEAQVALGVCNDGTPGPDGLTAEGIDFADSILDAHHEARRDAPEAGAVDERRRKALKWYFEVDGVPYNDEACEGFGVTPEGDPGPEGLTEAGIDFADKVVAHLDRLAIMRHFGLGGPPPRTRKRRQPTERERIERNVTASLIDALGLREALRHALRAAAVAIVRHIDADDERDEHGEHDDAEVGAVGIVGPTDVPDDVREAVHGWVRKVFGPDVDILDIDRDGKPLDDDKPAAPRKPFTGEPVETDAEAFGDAEHGGFVVDLGDGFGTRPEPGEPAPGDPGLVPAPEAATTEWPSRSTPPTEARDAVIESHGASSSTGRSSGDDGGSAAASPASASSSSDSPSGGSDAGSGGSGGE